MRIRLSLLPLLLFHTVLLAQVNQYRDLLPSHQLAPIALSDENVMRSLLQSCFALTANGSLPSGYAILGFDQVNGKFVSRLVSSTFKNNFVESCLVAKANEFKSQGPSARNWSYCHISAHCSAKAETQNFNPENVRCSIELTLTSSKDSNKFNEQVEDHWKNKQPETNENYKNAAGALYEILRMKK